MLDCRPLRQRDRALGRQIMVVKVSSESESLVPAQGLPAKEPAAYIGIMCNRIRGLKEWSEIPRTLARTLINFEYNPNVAPTEQVPAFLAERSKKLETKMARQWS
jgi:hypothetical protein